MHGSVFHFFTPTPCIFQQRIPRPIGSCNNFSLGTLYGMFCPDFSSDGGQPSNSTNIYSNTISWDCNINGKSLSTYPNDPGFVIVEDDAVLKNPNAFIQEVCNAHHHQLEFYSLYRSPLQWKGRRSSSCIYLHGTVAFYIRRPIMEKIVNERRRGWFCRFPIDMYISKMGPWYATRRDVVDHLDLGRIGST